ncbi:copper chaperone PCu(A)C [Brevundimonas aveniformis]|uniref:copper chaperone PCu(A)C n=1 Tax=Brevundimonas aveniformis TaxID=370977 RepID=UPI0003FBB633|nr:copper chaperone PCu(A)C [Brevundimonas aveniformis]
MKRLILSVAVGLALLAGAPARSWAQELPAAEVSAKDPFVPLYPLIGRTWRGISLGPDTAEDVVRWDWAVDGHAVRAVHAVNGGVYGGETTFFPDGESGNLIFSYLTSGGFHTNGSLTVRPDGVMEIEQMVHGLDGLERLRSTVTVPGDGTYQTRTLVERDGRWVPFGGFDYRIESGATVPRLSRSGEQSAVSVGELSLSRRIVANPGEPGDVAAYLRIENAGPADRLVAVSCTCAERIEMHRIDRSGDRPAMVSDASWAVEAEDRLDVRPGSPLHLMLIGFDPARAEHGQVELVLSFEQAGDVSAGFDLTPDSRASWVRFD